MRKCISTIVLVALFMLMTTGIRAAPEAGESTWTIREWYNKYTNVVDCAKACSNMITSAGSMSAISGAHASGYASIVSRVHYLISGIAYMKDPVNNFWNLSGETDLPAGHPCYLIAILCIDAQGIACHITPATFASTEAAALADIPEYPENKAVLGYVIVGNAGVGHDWDAVDLNDNATGTPTFKTIYLGYPSAQKVTQQ